MEEQVNLGEVGKLDLVLSGGKAVLTLTTGYDKAGLAATVGVTVQTSVLLDLVLDAVKNASPDGAKPIVEGLKNVVKGVVEKL